MNRFTELPRGSFDIWNSDILVRCPRCGELGEIPAATQHTLFRCLHCHYRQERKCVNYHYRASGHCTACGRYYRVDWSSRQAWPHPTKRVSCTWCGACNVEQVRSVRRSGRVYRPVREGKEPWFELPLYYQTTYRGRTVWALNRAHLIYLIQYLEADLREKPVGAWTIRTQGEQLPAWTRLARNRRGLVRTLQKLL